MNLSDASVAARLDSLMVPPDVASELSRIGVGIHLVERLVENAVDWALVRPLFRTHAFRNAQDVAALVNFLHDEHPHDDIRAWAALGSLDAAYRLHLKSVTPAFVQAFPRSSDDDLGSFLKMLQRATETGTGIHVEDLLWWHTAGVVSLRMPYLDVQAWMQWRSAAVHHLGMRPAALAAAAGMSVAEAVEQKHRGNFDVETLRMMAGLRAGIF